MAGNTFGEIEKETKRVRVNEKKKENERARTGRDSMGQTLLRIVKAR